MTVLSDAFHATAREIIDRYPSPRSALLLLLHEAQDEVGHVSDDVIREVAAVLGLEEADVAGVVTFYTMYKRSDPGRHLISVCSNTGCVFFGADETCDALRRLLGDEGRPVDGVSWEQVECLAYCSAAPAAQVNYVDVPNLTPERAQRLVAGLRDGTDTAAVIGELRADAKLPEISGA